MHTGGVPLTTREGWKVPSTEASEHCGYLNPVAHVMLYMYS